MVNTENELENFLRENKNVIYSIKTLSKRLNIRKKHVYYLYKNSDNIIKSKPLDVGCNKFNFNIFQYKE